jgi:L-ascorbate metabolism protein UlaG (beta-lactamase superfamily)
VLPWVYDRVFPRWHPRDELRPRAREAPGAALRIRWLGTAGHVIETDRTRVLIDPYVSRAGFRRLAGARLVPDEAAIAAYIPAKVDAILCGHSHFDHLLDAPFIAKKTGALLVGSRTTCAFGRASGLPEAQLIDVPLEGRHLTIGDIDVRFIPSLHGRVVFKHVPFKGEMPHVDRLPARAFEYRIGGVFGLLLRAGGSSVYHNGSADLVDAAIEGEQADVLLVGLAARRDTRDYVGRLTRSLRPKLLVPTHHDSFFGPLDRGVHLLPGIDLDGFVNEARRLAPGARVITPDYHETLAIPASEARDAVLLG